MYNDQIDHMNSFIQLFSTWISLFACSSNGNFNKVIDRNQTDKSNCWWRTYLNWANFERRIHFWLDEMKLQSHTSIHLSRWIWDHFISVMVEILFQNDKILHFVHSVTCSVYIDHGTGHMLGWERAISCNTTWTGVNHPLIY